MYDLREVRAATNAWWTGLASHFRGVGLVDVPRRLTRVPAVAWDDPVLLFSQTCGYPLTHALAGRVVPVGTPAFDAPGCRGARYASALVVREASAAEHLEDLREHTVAVNAPDSHSGYNVLRRMVAPLATDGRFFAAVVETGGHVESIVAVATGEADLCAVDAVTHALLARHAPARLSGTRVLGFSPGAPGLPYIAGPAVSAADRDRMQDALQAAAEDPGLAATRAALLIHDVEPLPASAYDEIPAMEREAVEMGYPEVA
jgi:ABC-type phosphate/phosphonate transport system substrate-binding protein